MTYIEQILNNRINELEIQKKNLYQKLRDTLNQKENFEDVEWDLIEINVVLEGIKYKLDELKELKKGLGLVSPKKVESSQEKVSV